MQIDARQIAETLAKVATMLQVIFPMPVAITIIARDPSNTDNEIFISNDEGGSDAIRELLDRSDARVKKHIYTELGTNTAGKPVADITAHGPIH